MCNCADGTNIAPICCGIVLMPLTFAAVVAEADKESGLASCANLAATDKACSQGQSVSSAS